MTMLRTGTMKWIFAICLAWTATSVAEQPRASIPGGSVVLQPGYHASASSRTRAVFRVEEDEIAFESDIGPSTGPQLTEKNVHLCKWSRMTRVNGRKIIMGIWKDRDVATVTISGKSQDPFKSANFYGEFDRVEDVGDLILTALSFEPSK